MPHMSDRFYNALKYLAQIALPAGGTLYFALAQIWKLPHGEEVVGSITSFDAFLGVLLGLNTKVYNSSDARFDGTIDVKENADRKVFILDLKGDPEQLDQKPHVTFKINPS